ncbi:hypothetical protein LTR86_008139 [Recurvomyces mirabilis]|nr:hypothetical protein LTR86_008139 [Recurvomyces mirabilis]
MEPYDPRQWGQGRQASGSQMVYGRTGSTRSTREATGMEEAMPSPPPPYSPETPGGSRVAPGSTPVLGSVGFTASPLPADSARSSPQMPMSPAFPPPPGQSTSRFRDRSTSGLAGPRALLAGLRGKQPVTAEPPLSPAFYGGAPFVEVHAPAARRAASTGHLQSAGHPAFIAVEMNSSARASPESSWQQGTALPGPPPGPPPPNIRSQSLNRYPTGSSTQSVQSATSSHAESFQRRRAAASTLGPVPPTPADWTDTQDVLPHLPQQPVPSSSIAPAESDPQYQPLRIDTGTRRETSITRRPARRDKSAQGIQERRSLSRRAKDRTEDLMSPLSDDSRPSESSFHLAEGTINRRREHMRSVSGVAGSSSITAVAKQQAQISSTGTNVGQPQIPSSVLTPPYTPAVKQDLTSRRETERTRATSSARPVSHLLHTPNEESAMPAPLSPARPPSAGSMKSSTRLDSFALEALGRHRAFVEKESLATSDEERLELFANFMVHESRLRRDRYQVAYGAMAGDILDLTRDMWRPYGRDSKRAVTPSTSMSSFDPTAPSWASDGQPSSAQGMPSSASSLGDFTPATDAASIGDVAEAFERSESRQWTEAFKPTLSPIPSMAQSTVPDEESSRGRTASRWWEQSQSGSGSGSIGKPDRLERTHRETKYMGVKAAELQNDAEPSPALSRQSATPGASATFPPDVGEYPPEKTGWHDGVDFDTPMATPARIAERKSSTSSNNPLDISRLITLPPPYPRHHPAINNSHPLLTSLRNDHRTLADHTDHRSIKDTFLDSDFAIRQQQKELAKERRQKLRSSVQGKIADGTISFGDAAQAEKDFDVEEADRGKANARANFDRFETQVAQPLNTTISERIAKADACIAQLKNDLHSRNQTSDPNRAQEEGDEQPERLETLTLLKWLFEVREQLHKEMFDLHAERSEQYSEVILTPYRIQRLQTKIDEATTFFAKDSRQRRLTFAQETQARFEDLQGVMEHNVSRGVEDQLSAFWDIAPGLLEITARIPIELEGFEVMVPAAELEENLGYVEYPLQYLWTLLGHAGRSAYQFIEGQINLLCLLHEVRTATSKGTLRLLEVEGSGGGGGEGDLAGARREAEARLTADLQDKVGEVERQWREALGEGLEEYKGRVRAFLEVTGGWEDGLEG